MSDHVVPHFHNDAGVSVIEIGSQEFMCVGANPPFDHPHVFLDLGNDNEIICPYCSTLYRFAADLAAARPARRMRPKDKVAGTSGGCRAQNIVLVPDRGRTAALRSPTKASRHRLGRRTAGGIRRRPSLCRRPSRSGRTSAAMVRPRRTPEAINIERRGRVARSPAAARERPPSRRRTHWGAPPDMQGSLQAAVRTIRTSNCGSAASSRK